MKKLIVFATVFVGLALLGYQIWGLPKTVEATLTVDNCGDEFTYEKTSDYDDLRVHFEFEEDESWDEHYKRTISLTAGSGYQIVDIWLEVEDIDQSGWDLHFTSALNNYNPNPGKEIETAKAIVKKVCASPTATATCTSTATATATASPEATETPNGEETQSPEPTDNGDVCDNIDGIQTGVPEGKHLDASGLNCVEYQLGGAPAPAEVTSTPEVLGASSMAGTGVAEENIFNLVFVLGSLLSAFGIRKFSSSRVK